MVSVSGLLSVGRTWAEELTENCSDQETIRHLRVTAINDPPYLLIAQLPNGTYRYDGYLFKLWEIITRKLDLHYHIVPLPGGGFGSLAKNGTWTGMVGELAYGRADVALTGLIIRPDRKTVVDFVDTVAVSQDRPSFWIRAGSAGVPEMSPSIFNSLLHPLHAHVWWMLIAALLVMTVVLRVTVRFNRGMGESQWTGDDMTWGSCALASFMMMVSQGWATTPDSLAARIVVISGWMLGMLIYHNYTANLISHLAVATVHRPISSLREFSEQPGWVLAIEPGYGILNDWKVSKDVYERDLYRRTVSGEGYIQLNIADDSVRETIKEKVLTYVDFGRLMSSLGPEACALVPLLREPAAKSNNYIAVAKGRDKTRRAINRVMELMNQAGIISRLRKYWFNTGEDMCDRPNDLKELSFVDLLAVVILVPIALGLSLAILALEWVFSKMYIPYL